MPESASLAMRPVVLTITPEQDTTSYRRMQRVVIDERQRHELDAFRCRCCRFRLWWSGHRLPTSPGRALGLRPGARQTLPPGAFPRTPREMALNFWDPSEGYYGLFDIWSFRGKLWSLTSPGRRESACPAWSQLRDHLSAGASTA